MAKITLIEELETQTPRVSKVDGFQQLNISKTHLNTERERAVLAIMSRARALTVIRCWDSSQAMYLTLRTACRCQRRLHSSSSCAFVSRGRRRAMSCCCRDPNRTSSPARALRWRSYAMRRSSDDAIDSCCWHSPFGDCCLSAPKAFAVRDDQSC